MKINILGTDYELLFGTPEQYEKLNRCDAYNDLHSKKIVIRNKFPDDREYMDNIDNVYIPKLIRHEIVHAFMYESGLWNNSEWGSDETLTDWIAIQTPKLFQVFEAAVSQIPND